MVTHEAWLTKLFNAYLGGFGNWLLALFHMKPANPAEPWADFMVMQHIFEIIHGFVAGEAEGQIGHHAPRYTLLFETLFVFLIVSNLLGIIPGFVSPTQVIYVPVGCALLVFLYFNWAGIQKHGIVKYSSHFVGPIPWMAPLMIPIEIISTLARPLSLSVRLFANIYAGEKVTLVFLTLTYLVFPAVFMGLHVFIGLLQAYIFVLLTMIYVAGAVEEAH